MEALPFTDEESCECCGIPLEEFSYRLCAQCSNEKRYFRHSFVPLRYEEEAKQAVLNLKFNYHPYNAKALAFLIADKILSSEFYTEFNYITFVPETRKRITERGYNQAELIAKELSEILKIPCVPTLIRTKNGQRQATLNKEERKENARKSYVAGERTFSGGTVLLVDDVYTTGETTNHCAKLLKKIGFDEVYLGIATIRCSD